MNTVVIGSQWGDEGKGKIIDYLSKDIRVVVRYQGGSNAGHTVYRGKHKHVMHLVPSGILQAGVQCLIGNGVVVDPAQLISEIKELESKGVKVKGRLLVSEQCHLIFPYHKIYDQLREAHKGLIRIGTTGRGIGPCYSDRALRSGIRLIDLQDKEMFAEQLRLGLKEKNEIFKKLYGFKGFSFKQIYDDYLKYARTLKPYTGDAALELAKAAKRGKKILFEGAQGTLLDIDHGTYPFVTSSSTVSGGASVGTGLPPTAVKHIMGVAKAYTTRVGEGPFPTEFDETFMETMRSLGEEFGATTGRARRCGWLDAVILRYSARINGLTSMALTKLDVLDSLDEIKIAVGYKYKGKTVKEFPHSIAMQREVVPVYETMKGWKASTGSIKEFSKLPANAKKYIRKVAKLSEVPIHLVSVGKGRDQVIRCNVK